MKIVKQLVLAPLLLMILLIVSLAGLSIPIVLGRTLNLSNERSNSGLSSRTRMWFLDNCHMTNLENGQLENSGLERKNLVHTHAMKTAY